MTFLGGNLLDDKIFCTQQMAGRQQLRKLSLTSGNVLVQKQIAGDNIYQSPQDPIYPMNEEK